MGTTRYHGIGLMSGTSLDGVDLAYCNYTLEEKWSFNLLAAKTFHYDDKLKTELMHAHHFSGVKLMALDAALAKHFSICINHFVDDFKILPQFISSHGHTVFHQPVNKQDHLQVFETLENRPFTTQIGSGAIISALTGIDVVCDFRTADVALGGQGAPLVPIGDAILFNQYDYCLNLGGIANISFDKNTLNNKTERLASDLCFANMGLNYLASKVGLDYDADGKLAASGFVDALLLEQLNNLEFHQQPFPKSIGKEYFEKAVRPLLDESTLEIKNKLRTFCEHILIQIKNNLPLSEKINPTLLITGGGAHHVFLTDLIRRNSNASLVILSDDIIDFKEAILFGFLGVLRLRGENNTLSSVTGAGMNTCSGAIYKGQKIY